VAGRRLRVADDQPWTRVCRCAPFASSPRPPPPRAWQVQWAEGMRTILGLDLPWLSLAASLAEADDKGRINYSHFLDRCVQGRGAVCAGEAGGGGGGGGMRMVPILHCPLPAPVRRYRIAMRDTDVMWMEGIVQRVCQRLFAACHTLEAAYRYFDVDGSGVIGPWRVGRGAGRTV
jgi:hypothetical protein